MLSTNYNFFIRVHPKISLHQATCQPCQVHHPRMPVQEQQYHHTHHHRHTRRHTHLTLHLLQVLAQAKRHTYVHFTVCIILKFN